MTLNDLQEIEVECGLSLPEISVRTAMVQGKGNDVELEDFTPYEQPEVEVTDVEVQHYSMKEICAADVLERRAESGKNHATTKNVEDEIPLTNKQFGLFMTKVQDACKESLDDGYSSRTTWNIVTPHNEGIFKEIRERYFDPE